MLLRLCLLLAFVSCVRTKNDFARKGIENLHSEFNWRFASWPSVHNGATLLRIRRQSQSIEVQGASEGIAGTKSQAPIEQTTPQPSKPNTPDIQPDASKPHEEAANESVKTPEDKPINEGTLNNSDATKNNTDTAVKSDSNEVPPKKISNETPKDKTPVSPPKVESTPVAIRDNGTTSMKATKEWDLSDPEATKRGLIVFGGFALLALGYYLFFGTKKKYQDTKNTNSNDANQFRYGVLQSEDRRDNLELSRVPLTMESDDEEDDDLEIFDLEQKKKSLSYVNLQTNDEDIVLSPRERSDGDQLLLDIEDGNSDTLINWSNNGSKSIL